MLLNLINYHFKNNGLFIQSVFDASTQRENQWHNKESNLGIAEEHLLALIDHWRGTFPLVLKPVKSGEAKQRQGVPPGFSIISNTSESEVEQGLIRTTLETIGYKNKIANNKSLKGENKSDRPDMILFGTDKDMVLATQGLDKKSKTNGRDFCRAANCILEAKKPSESVDNTKHIQQLHNYLENYDKDWGILSNGLSWRLYHRSNSEEYLQFNLIEFLQPFVNKNGRKPTPSDIKLFSLFEYLFGSKAHSSNFLKDLLSATVQESKVLRDVLKDNAHKAVERIATGFWKYEDNRDKGWILETPQQSDLDYLREQSLILLYRLLFILNAESRGLLLKEKEGEVTAYANKYALSKLLKDLKQKTSRQLEQSSVYEVLLRLFKDIDTGSSSNDVPAYNGGLFNPNYHVDLDRWGMTDGSLMKVLTALMYVDGDSKREIVWRELNVRDLGDVYEGLLEQRLIIEANEARSDLTLKNEKGERKASGSYFTPDSIVTQLVNATLLPLLEGCEKDPNKILSLRVLDPAMGSGHFLVKVVDIMGRFLAVNCDPQDLKQPDKGVKDTNDEEERSYWKRKVVENCIYGVDYNPMSVELAKVALWLHTAEYGKPLSFLSHHLKVGNSLLGANIDDLKEPALMMKSTKSGDVWKVKPRTKEVLAGKMSKKEKVQEKQLSLMDFMVDENIISGVLENVRNLLAVSSLSKEDILHKREEYQKIVDELSAHKLLADLWCAQWLFINPDENGIKAFGEHGNSIYNQLLKICNIKSSELRQEELIKFKNNPFIKEVRKNAEHGYGARPTMFFHWQLEFPEVAFDANGQAKDSYGFDAVLGNPPWDKIKPETKAFYGPYSVEVANSQGTSIKSLVYQLENQYPHLPQEWVEHVNTIKQTVFFLKETQHYQHQSTLVNGKKTGGDPDLFRFFIERAYQCVRVGGRVGFVTPAALWQAEGCTALRKLLLKENQLEQLYTFENFRKWAFQIHTSFKFTSFVFQKRMQGKPIKAGHRFNAAFMLRDDVELNYQGSPRLMKLSYDNIQNLSPDTLALLDFKSAGDSTLVAKLHKSFKALGNSDWAIKYRRELDMTNDAYLFRDPEWMVSRGFKGLTANSSEFYENRGYTKRELALKDKSRLVVYIHSDDIQTISENSRLSEDHFYLVPDETYVPLYEGRMVHIFDHCQQEYLDGEGRKAKWGRLGYNQKLIRPRVYVSLRHAQIVPEMRLGFCDVTGATNERSTLACILPKNVVCGNTVPTFTSEKEQVKHSVLLGCVMNSFVFDLLIRFRVSLHLNMNFLTQVPVPQLGDIDEQLSKELCQRAVKLSCTTPEMSSYWNEVFPENPWTEKSAEKDLQKRAVLRAEIDARIASLYDLSLEDYARILTHFPLMDRKYEPLAGDKFIAEGTDKEKTDRAFITRDFALHHYILYKRELGEKVSFIEDLERFYRDKVKIDPKSAESRFRVGEIKDLETRVETSLAQGAIPYVPS